MPEVTVLIPEIILSLSEPHKDDDGIVSASQKETCLNIPQEVDNGIGIDELMGTPEDVQRGGYHQV